MNAAQGDYIPVWTKLPRLEKVTHPNLLQVRHLPDFKAGSGKPRGTKTDHGVARKAKSLSRDSKQRIKLVIRIGIMNHRHGIAAIGKPVEMNGMDRRRHRSRHRIGIINAAWEIGWVGGQTNA